MAALEVAPKAGRNVLESFGVAVLIAIVGSLVVVYGKGGTWTEAAVISGSVAVVAFFFYSFRFMRKGIKHLRLHDDGLDATMRDKTQLRLVWARLKDATLTDDYGGCWALRYQGGEFRLRDDGFSVDEWDEVSARIRLEMARVGKETQAEGIQAAFEPSDEVKAEAVAQARRDDWVTPWSDPDA